MLSPMLPLKQSEILEFIVAEASSPRRGNNVSGRLLRGKVKGILNEDLTELQRFHLSSWGAYPNDWYRVTFEGLLASSRVADVRRVLLAVLRTWIAKAAVDPEFRLYSWEEVKRALPDEQRAALEETPKRDEEERHFFDLVIGLGKVADRSTMEGSPPVWHWYTPDHVEPLMEQAGETGDLDQFIKAVRDHLNRPPPVPARAPFLPEYDDGVEPEPEAPEVETLDDAVHAVLKILIGSKGAGRPWCTGSQLGSESGLPPHEINDAVELLKDRGYVKTIGGMGTAPFRFLQVQVAPDGRAFYEADRKPAREEPSPEKEVVSVDPKKVMVIHGRDGGARRAMFDFLRALKLEPIEWSDAIRMTGSAAPYVGQALDAAFAKAQAVVALFTGDDEVRLRPHLLGADPEEPLTPQARPNVLLEAGMALGSHEDRVVLVEVGKLRAVSDLSGRHVVRVAGDGLWRHDVADRLKNAGCSVETVGGRDWLEAGAELERIAAASGPSSSPAKAEGPEYPVPEMQNLFGLHVEERVRGMGRGVTINLREEQRSDKVWSKLSIEQLKDAVHRVILTGHEEFDIQSEVGAIIVMRWVRPRI